MRVIRLAALVGSVMLLVATTVWMIATRADLRQRQDARAAATAALAATAARSTVTRATALTEVANANTDPASLEESFGDGVSACIVTESDKRCTDIDLVALAGFEDAARVSVERGGAAVAVDDTDRSILVVTRRLSDRQSSGDTAATAVIRVPVEAFVSDHMMDLLETDGVSVIVRPSSTPATDHAGDAHRADGQVIVDATIGLPDDGGSIEIRASVVDDVGLVGDGLPMYGALLILGTILMGLAGWTFLLDRRALERRATTDELTGLANRREFERQTAEALLTAERFNTGVCVMLIDLNGFKQINDTLGHHIGDRVLQRAAQRLRGSVRETDVVARWGGDEFVILLPGVEDGTGVRASAERVGQALAGAPIVDDITVTAAIGAALFPRHGTTLDTLVHAADVAMYSAKTTGVTYRLADPLDADPANTVITPSGYHGPDRRRPGAPRPGEPLAPPEAGSVPVARR